MIDLHSHVFPLYKCSLTLGHLDSGHLIKYFCPYNVGNTNPGAQNFVLDIFLLYLYMSFYPLLLHKIVERIELLYYMFHHCHTGQEKHCTLR